MDQSEDLLHLGPSILARLAALSKNVAIYPPHHPMVMELATEICDRLMTLFARRRRVRFHAVNSEIYVEKHLLQEESLKYADFIELLTQWGMNSLSFDPGVTSESIALFFSLINKKEQAQRNDEWLRQGMKEHGITGITFEKLLALDLMKDVYELVEKKEISKNAQASYDEAVEYMQSVEQDVLSNGPINAFALRSAVSSLMEVFLEDHDAVMGILSIKSYDEYLFRHSVNVAITSLLIAKRLGFDKDVMRMVGVSGLLHDIGKMKIPRDIVNKPGQLTEDEWSVMRRHTIEGAQILMRCEMLDYLPVLAALEHHAGYDLCGYPTLKGKKRPHAIARIVGIADVYEALTANRSYRSAHSVSFAINTLIKGAGKQFDPLLVKTLLSITGVFPPGSIVRLKMGDNAIVVEPNEDKPFSPKVRLLHGTPQEIAAAPVIDTAEDPAEYAVMGVADLRDF
jgi:putative nucleotidyltransferase with HDIG domain